ncbi:MAG: ATP-binding protein [Lachnospiraceae bacterium]|nr:ATP-binding protein [Lachnospiraceae bacterium]
MSIYHTYQEFWEDLLFWGDCVWKQQTSFHPKESFFTLLYKAVQSAEQEVFSPFLYISLAARLEWEDMMLLAAALYTQQKGEPFTFALWKQFWPREEGDFPGTRLFYQSNPLLLERVTDTEETKFHLQIPSQIFLFLQGNLPGIQQIPGMDWYDLREDSLPALGKNIRLYEQIHTCLTEIPGPKLVYLEGPKGSGRKLNYAYLARKLQMNLAVISYEKLQTEPQLRDMQRSCLLHHAMFVIELSQEEEDLSPLLYWLNQEETLFLLGSRPNLPDFISSQRQYLPFSICPHDVLKDKELFEQLTLSYHWESEQTRMDFLNRYNFLPGRMQDILELAKSYGFSEGAEGITDTHLRKAVLEASSHSLDQYAKKIQVFYQMRDLILPDSTKEKLSHIIQRIRNRKLVYETWGFLEKSAYGNGVSMIFAGPPGTGKTMAAQVMAGELGMELYRVELPAVVDKYIGETEKKLNRIFGEAEKSMAILFFDEADILFSKRTEIKESNDKYSNMEIAFLLQKMEEYEGISILATNYLQNFDGAFRRRVSDVIDFPLPDASLRLTMWRSMIPAKLPVSDEIDFSFLAEQFELSGSMIKNTLIYASFLAAESQEPLLTMEEILKGLGHEFEKSGKKLSRKEYGAYGHLF